MFSFLADQGFTLLSITRRGYVKTPLSVGETMEQQADALAALLDALNIPKVAVICGSGRAPASLLFTLRYPDRCWALTLISALTTGEMCQNLLPVQMFFERIFNNDFLIWLVATFFWWGLVEAGMGNLNDEIRNDPAKVAELRAIVSDLILISPSRKGMDNDKYQWRNHMPTFNFAEIKIPTFIIHSRNDKSVPYKFAERSMTIPNAQTMIFEDGGHTCYIVYSEKTHPATVEFLRKHQPV